MKGECPQITGSPSNGKIFTAGVTVNNGNNMLSVAATDFATPSAHVSTSNYIVTVTGGQDRSYTYDNNGNPLGYTSAGGNVTCEWEGKTVWWRNGSSARFQQCAGQARHGIVCVGNERAAWK